MHLGQNVKSILGTNSNSAVKAKRISVLSARGPSAVVPRSHQPCNETVSGATVAHGTALQVSKKTAGKSLTFILPHSDSGAQFWICHIRLTAAGCSDPRIWNPAQKKKRQHAPAFLVASLHSQVDSCPSASVMTFLQGQLVSSPEGFLQVLQLQTHWILLKFGPQLRGTDFRIHAGERSGYGKTQRDAHT